MLRVFHKRNIITTLIQSSFGAINGVIKTIFPDQKMKATSPIITEDTDTESLSDVLKLPKIVVIGSETSGKSTLLQNITCRKIFPDGFKQTTRFPIRLILQAGSVASVEVTWRGETKIFTNDAEIIAHIRDAISKLPLHTVTNEEMVVKITDANVPNFELVDLPGLSFSPTMDAVSQMVSDYCADENTLVLLVVTASTTALINDHGVHKVTQLAKRDKCVLCLTMCDTLPATVSEEDDEFVQEQKMARMNEQLIDRILMNNLITVSEDNPRTPGMKYGEVNVMSNDSVTYMPFRACVATAHLNNSKGAAEQDYFDNVINNLSPNIEHFADDLKKHFTCSAVLRELDGLYHNHMKSEWCPKVIDRLDQLIAKNEAELTRLGADPATLTPRDVWTHLLDKLDKKAVATSIASLVALECSRHVFAECACDAEVFNFENLLEFRKLGPAVTSVLGALSREKLAGTLFFHFKIIFEEQEDKKFMLGRFEYLALKIEKSLTALFNAETYVKRDNARLIRVANDIEMMGDGWTVRDNWRSFSGSVEIFLAATALDVLDDLTAEFDLVTSEADGLSLLREREEVASTRSELEEHLKVLRKHRLDMLGFDTFLK